MMNQNSSRHIWIYRLILLLVVATLPLEADDFPASGDALTLDHAFHDVGNVWQVITNLGYLGYHCYTTYGPQRKCEYPIGSNNSYLYGGGLLVAAKRNDRKLFSVSTAWSRQSTNCAYEFFPSDAPWDTVWTLRRGETADIPYLPNYTAWSDQELICRYSDYAIDLEDQVAPLFVDVIQISHAWAAYPFDEAILFEFFIIPTQDDLTDVYPAWYGEIELNPAGKPAHPDNLVYFDETRYMGVVEDQPGNDDDMPGPCGYIVFPPEGMDAEDLTWTFNNFDQVSHYDEIEYDFTSSGVIDPPSMDGDGRGNPGHFRLSFGPVDVPVGDTLHFMVGEIFGEGQENFLKNADRLIGLRSNDFKTPAPPPDPDIAVIPGNHSVTISWAPDEVNPETYTDPYRFDGMDVPFEGYRLYKSTQGIGGPWSLLQEYDLPDNGFFTDSGIEYSYVDQGLVNNLEYFYTVTAFSKPDTVVAFPSQESSRAANARRISPGTAPPETVGEVAVVPNPYRGDASYSNYNPPWEIIGETGRWLEQDRRIQFINLPEQCEIKIYTISGDLVNTLQHDNPVNGFEDWNLTSISGQTVASGIYLYSAKDTRNGKVQVGRFVVIK